MEFAKLLTKYREQRDITKTDLARLLKVTPTYIMNLESGRAIPPSYERLKEIQSALKLNDNEKHNLTFALHLGRAPEPLRKFLMKALFPTIMDVASFPLFRPFPDDKQSVDEDFKFLAESHIYRIHGNFLEPIAKDGQRIIVSTTSYFINPDKHGSILLIQVEVHNEEIAKKLREFTGNENVTLEKFKSKPYEIIAKFISHSKGVMTVEHIEHEKRYLVFDYQETQNVAEILGVLF